MAKGRKPKKRLVSMDTEEVSIVNAGANGHKAWLLVKSDEDTDGVEKAVPSSDASDEDKRKAQSARSKQYGIEALSDGANLSYPAGDPTTEGLYADPVNLKYPLGYGDNKRDSARIKSAISYFKGNYSVYSKDTSRARIYERIVRAALAENIQVSYDENDEVDKLLPADLKARLSKTEEEESKSADDTDENGESDEVSTGSQDTDVSTEQEENSGQGADLVTDLTDTIKKSRDLLSGVANMVATKELLKQARLAIEATRKSPENVVDDAADEDGDQSASVNAAVLEEQELLKKQAAEKDAEIRRLKKALVTKERAQKAREGTAIATSKALRTREMIKQVDNDSGEIDASGKLDLSPPLERPE